MQTADCLSAMSPEPKTHEALRDAFRSIEDKNALAWAILDGKSELHVTQAIATAINRRAGARIAHVEFPPRIDLVILDAPLTARERRHLDARRSTVQMKYQAKAGHAFDFSSKRVADSHPYLGSHLNEDMNGLVKGAGAALFYLYETEEANRHLKYFAGERVPVETAIAALCRFVTKGTLVAREALDCGIADGTQVKIHLCVFDPAEG